jgi:hypothetical protein
LRVSDFCRSGVSHVDQANLGGYGDPHLEQVPQTLDSYGTRAFLGADVRQNFILWVPAAICAHFHARSRQSAD